MLSSFFGQPIIRSISLFRCSGLGPNLAYFVLRFGGGSNAGAGRPGGLCEWHACFFAGSMCCSYQWRRHQIGSLGSGGRISTQKGRHQRSRPRDVFSATRRTYSRGQTGTEPWQTKHKTFLNRLVISGNILHDLVIFLVHFELIFRGLTPVTFQICLAQRGRLNRCFSRGGLLWSHFWVKMNFLSFCGARKSALDMRFLDYDYDYQSMTSRLSAQNQSRHGDDALTWAGIWHNLYQYRTRRWRKFQKSKPI